MLLPSSLLLPLPLLSNAIPQHRPSSSSSQLTLASRKLNTRQVDVVGVCPACSTWLATSSYCWQLPTLMDVRGCFCIPDVFNTINECIACPEILQFNGWNEFVEDYEDLVYDASAATPSCAELKITGLPSIINGSFPANPSTSTSFASATGYDPSTTTASDLYIPAELWPTEISSSRSEATSVGFSPSKTANSSKPVASSTSPASAPVVVSATSSGCETFKKSLVVMGAAGAVGICAALV